MMDFQELASKVKAAAAKINFDQMAANDDYIHSDDLNVKGRHHHNNNNSNRRKSNAETSEQLPEEHNVTRQVNKTHVVDSTTPRETFSSSAAAASSSSTTINRAHHFSAMDDLKNHSSHTPTTAVDRRHASQQPLLRQSTMPLLSVVADTLAQAQQQRATTAQHQLSQSATTLTMQKVEAQPVLKQSSRHGTRQVGHQDDSDSDDNVDDDDAIFSSLRQPATTDFRMTTVASSSHTTIRPATIELSDLNLGLQQLKKKNKNPNRFMNDFDQMELSDQSSSSQHQQKKKNPKRFLEDLDQRLSTPLDLEAGSTTTTTTTTASTSGEHDGDMDYYDNSNNNNSNTQWTWLRNAVASSRINALLGQPLPLMLRESEKTTPVRKGPLSSRREVAPLLRNDDDDDVVPIVMVHSSSVLGAEEQAELARLSQRSSLLSSSSSSSRDVLGMIMEMFKENPTHSLFLIFTLLLALAVYFYSRNRSISGLT